MIIDELQRERFEKVLKKLSKQLAAVKETDEELLILKTDLEVLKSLNLNSLELKFKANGEYDLWRKAVQNLKNRKGFEIVHILWGEPKYFYEIEETDETPIEKKELEQRLRQAWRVMEIIDEIIRLSLPEKR